MTSVEAAAVLAAIDEWRRDGTASSEAALRPETPMVDVV